MIVIVVLYLLAVLLGIRLLWQSVIKPSAGFMALAIAGVRYSYFGPIPIVHFAITREKRIRNGVAAIVYTVLATMFIMLALYWLASLIGSVV